MGRKVTQFCLKRRTSPGRRVRFQKLKSIFISRILSRPKAVTAIYLIAPKSHSRPKAGATITRVYPPEGDRTGCSFALLCLAPHGVYLASPVTRRSGELLPRHFTLTEARKLRRFVFCGTFRRPRVIRGLPGFHQACCHVVFGLSSRQKPKFLTSDRLRLISKRG